MGCSGNNPLAVIVDTLSCLPPCEEGASLRAALERPKKCSGVGPVGEVLASWVTNSGVDVSTKDRSLVFLRIRRGSMETCLCCGEGLFDKVVLGFLLLWGCRKLKALLEEAAKVGQLKWQEVNEWLREVERITRITRIAGIEPTQTVLKTAVLPLNYTPKKSLSGIDRTGTPYGYFFNNIYPTTLLELGLIKVRSSLLPNTQLIFVLQS